MQHTTNRAERTAAAAPRWIDKLENYVAVVVVMVVLVLVLVLVVLLLAGLFSHMYRICSLRLQSTN